MTPWVKKLRKLIFPAFTGVKAAGVRVSMAVAIPLISVLSLIAFPGYLLWLNPLLALVSLAIYPFAVFVLPALQRRANQENKKRADASREFSGKIEEMGTYDELMEKRGLLYELVTGRS
jgi:ABC-type multidrug transport system fused ATPase/permease subunit